MTLLEMKKYFILECLIRNEHNRSKTARELEISVRTLRNYIKDWWPELRRKPEDINVRNIHKMRDLWANQKSWG